MTRTSSLATGIVLLLLATTWFAGRFVLLEEQWRTGAWGLLGWGLAWAFMLGGAWLLGRALWPQPLEHEAGREVDTTDPFDEGPAAADPR